MPKGISIDRSKRLREEPRTGHNRWHPNVTVPALLPEGIFLEARFRKFIQKG